MNGELVLALHMANLAGAWEALAAAAETGADGSTAGSPAARERAGTMRRCAADLRDRLELHRSGPAWMLPGTC